MIKNIKTQGISSSFAFVLANDSKLKGVKYATAYYLCDGVDDNVQIQDAINNYSTVVLSDGTFNLSSTLTGTSSIIGQGSSTVINQGALDIAMDLGLSSTLISTSTNITSNTITIADTSSLSVGDYIMISSSDSWHNIRAVYTTGEVLQIQSLTSTTITTTEDIWLDYNTLPRVYKYNLNTFKLQGFKVVYGTALSSQMIDISQGINIVISDVELDGNLNAKRGITVSNSINTKIQNCITNNVRDLAFSNFQIGYGIYLSGSVNNIVIDCQGTNNKHFIDMDKSNYQAITKNTSIINCTSIGNSQREPFTNHGGSYDTRFINCKHTIRLEDNNNGQGIGFLLRGVKSSLIGCEISGVISNSYTESAFNVGENVQQGGTGINGDGRCAEDLLIDNCTANLTRNTGGSFTSTSSGHFVDITTGCNNAVISNNTFVGLQNDGIFIEGNNNNGIEILNNNFTFSGHRTGEFLVNFSPKDSSVTNNVTFTNNTAINTNNTSTPYVKGTIANYTELNNNIQ